MSLRKAKKALLIRNAYAYDAGGAERYPVILAQVLAKNGWQAVIVSRHQGVLDLAKKANIKAKKGWWWSRQNWSGWRIIGWPLYSLWQTLLFAWYIQLILRLKPSVVHIQSRDDFIAATLAGRVLGKRVIWTDHADLKYIYQNIGVWYKNPVGKFVYIASKIAGFITVVSQNEKTEIEQSLGHGLDSHYRLIHNGVLDDPVTAAGRPEKLRSSVIFCSTSRLVTAKGIGELIEAFNLTQKTNPETHLWLVGDGPEADKFRALAYDYPDIEFVGYSDHAESYVAASDVFVHPSYHEGFSLSIIEAAKLGRPIIAGNTGGNPEIITDNQCGLLVPIKNVEVLAAAMTRLAKNPDLRTKFGQAARQRYEADYNFEQIVKEKILPLYE